MEVESGILRREVAFNLSTIAATATANQDFTPLAATLTFTPSESERCVTVSVADDGVVEEDEEEFTVRLDSSDPAAMIVRESVTVTIEDSSSVTLTFLRDGQTVSENEVATVCVMIEAQFERSLSYSLVVDREGENVILILIGY